MLNNLFKDLACACHIVDGHQMLVLSLSYQAKDNFVMPGTMLNVWITPHSEQIKAKPLLAPDMRLVTWDFTRKTITLLHTVY